MSTTRERNDLCPGACRPWQADDGLLVRVRVTGGRITFDQLSKLIQVAENHGNGRVYLTSRANLQIRGLASATGQLSTAQFEAIESTGLLPSRSHELVRNIMVSPLTGITGGLQNVQPLAEELDRRICATLELAHLSGRFLFVLDDGRADLVDRTADLGFVAVTETTVQLRVGDNFGPVVHRDMAVDELLRRAVVFAAKRGFGPDAPWHIAELPEPLEPALDRDARIASRSEALDHGSFNRGFHHAISESGLTRDDLPRLRSEKPLVITPWRGIITVNGPQND